MEGGIPVESPRPGRSMAMTVRPAVQQHHDLRAVAADDVVHLHVVDGGEAVPEVLVELGVVLGRRVVAGAERLLRPDGYGGGESVHGGVTSFFRVTSCGW
ncbi:hypothetical protein AB0I77_53040 [Streptomyces sp. NPDC050619]|uniref:hypothetical protein n=1 Tax=Streptomyces sp. NPDC050619 TaxID=3157214 RepID=UPI00341D37A8